MSFKKNVMAIAAVGALTAATAVPASALENEFHGSLAMQGVSNNYRTGGGTGYLDIAGDSTTTKTFVEQRARIFYSAKANDNLKLVTGFELDSTWGKSSYVLGRANDGGALGADSVNLETKWVYLDFNEPLTGVNVKAGIQGLNDSYKGVFVGGGADAAGVQLSKGIGPVTTTLGWFRLDDRTSTGKQARDLVLLDAKVAPTKDIKVGASYYFLNSDNAANQNAQGTAANPGPFGQVIAANALTDYNIHVLGVNAAATVGPATIDAFGLYEFGSVDKFGNVAQAHVNSFAANVAAKVKVGPGTAKLNALYVNGGTNAFVNVNNTTSAAFAENVLGGAMGNMFLLSRNPLYTTNDQFVIYDSGNRGQGVIGGSIGFDAKITDKAFANVNAGFAAVAKDTGIKPVNQNTGIANKSTYQGTEINAEVGYKVFDSLTASVQGAYVFLGDYYTGTSKAANQVGTDPADPFLGRVVLSYVF